MNIRRMYVRAHSTPLPARFPLPWEETTSPPRFPYHEENIPSPPPGSLWIDDANLGFGQGDSLEDPAQYPFDPPSDEQKKCVVFVHGVALDVPNQQGYTQTFFKRLWWEGYRGRLVAFRWCTPLINEDIKEENLTIFNSGEYRSWKGGASLRKYMDTLRSQMGNDAVISMAAHSLGNACAGEALRQGMKVNRYVAMEAAVPLSCYYPESADLGALGLNDEGLVKADNNNPTPRYVGQLGYQGYLNNIVSSLAAPPINYYSEDDFWLMTGSTSFLVPVNWMFNEAHTKPSMRLAIDFLGGIRVYADRRYDYESQLGQPRRPGFRYGWFYQRWVEDPHESMSFVSRSVTRSIGGGAPPDGYGGVDLKAVYQFDRERSCHSGQFQRDIQWMYGDKDGKEWADESGRPRPLFRVLMRDLNVNP
jgi:hypothetical protein